MTDTLLEAESHYDILESEDNELLFAIKSRDGNPKKPYIVYAGEEHAVFYRNEDVTIILDYIHPEVRTSFRKLESVLVAEFQEGSIIREYMVPVKQASELPVAEDKILALFNSLMETAVIILAAGDATRMCSAKPKYLHEIGGLPILDHIINTCKKFNFSRKILVTNPKHPLKRDGWDSVVQKDKKGTGAAVLAAKEKLDGFDGNVLVLYSDSPFITEATIKQMLKEKSNGKVGIVSLVFEAKDPKAYGRIVLKDKKYLDKIVEFKDASEEQKKITLCNGGNLLCDAELLFNSLDKVGNNNPAGEYWLTDVIAVANAEGQKCGYVKGDESEVLGVNTREELAIAEEFFQKRKRKEVMDSGVTLLDPETTYFSYDTVIGRDCVIEPCVYFANDVYIEPNSRVAAFSRVAKSRYQPVKGEEKIFTFKTVLFILAFVLVVFSPFLLWVGADDEKRGLCASSLEMCIVNSKYEGSENSLFGCVYGNIKCLARDVDTSAMETINPDALVDSDDIDPEYLENFLKNYK